MLRTFTLLQFKFNIWRNSFLDRHFHIKLTLKLKTYKDRKHNEERLIQIDDPKAVYYFFQIVSST